MSDQERQCDEVEALKWIYPQELAVVSDYPSSGSFKISPTLVEDELPVKIVTQLNGTSEERVIKVKYLPPLELFFKSPEDYPSRSEPMFMLSCVWLSATKLTKICQQLDKIWDSSHNSEILFSWASFLKEDLCSWLQISELCVTLNMDTVLAASSDKSLVKDSINKKNLALKELKNKRSSYERDVASQTCRSKLKRSKHHKRSRAQCSEDNFKYETPKDLEKKDEKATIVKIKPDDECSVAKNEEDCAEKETESRVNHILEALPTYGRRSHLTCGDFDSRVVPNYTEKTPSVVNCITEYNDRRLDVEFRSQSHACQICFDQKPGAACVCVKPCRHAFCKSCFGEYLTVNIREAQVQKLGCLDPNCDTVLSAQQIKQHVDEATFEKYLKFSRKLMVQNDADLLYCPRKFCQGIARLCDKAKDMGYCEQCAYYFCAFCKRSYHGIEMCKIKNDEVLKVIAEYQTAGPVRKAELEKRFSKQQIMKWIEEDLTEKLIKKCSKPCPNCGALIEKNLGCNKMLCFNCNIPFCWLCNTCLSVSTPYSHYQNKDSPCYEQLFPLLEDVGDQNYVDYENYENYPNYFFRDLNDVDDLDDIEFYYLDDALDYYPEYDSA